MKAQPTTPPLTICVLTYGDYFDLAHRCIESIRANTSRELYRLVVGANAVEARTGSYLETLYQTGHIDRLHRSRRNVNKCPMMRRMFLGLNTPYVCWFDDDSYVVEPGALERHLEIARNSPVSTVMWGLRAGCNHPRSFTDVRNVVEFVRTARWYGGLPPPDWRPGGKGEFDFEGGASGNPWWQFIVGGFWLIRTCAIRFLGWPDPRLIKLGDDVLLGEAVRQQGWSLRNTGAWGIAVNQARRRGEVGGLKDQSSRRPPTKAKLIIRQKEGR